MVQRSNTPGYYLVLLVILIMLSGCKKEDPNGNNDNYFVGGPENPASDGTYTSRIYSENGIASLEEINLNGDNQWILIRGYDVSKPVLIFLHGGPGSACIFYATYCMEVLEKEYVVVTWDQRASGKSYHEGIDPGSLTLEQVYSDTYELIQKMRSRFGVEKVYLMGISWGSLLGSKIAYEHPELLHAYIGIGQAVAPEMGIQMAYETVLAKAKESGHLNAIEELSAIDPDSTWFHIDVISKWVDEFGFGDFHDPIKASQIQWALAAGLTEYSNQDILDLDSGKRLYELSPLGTDLTWLQEIDLREQIPALDVPLFFLIGKYDYKTPAQLVEEYYELLDAPAGKEFILFENSAHIPILEEREVFHDIMLNRVL